MVALVLLYRTQCAIWCKKPATFSQPVKIWNQNQSVACSQMFSCAWCWLHVFCSSSHSFAVVFSPVVIVQWQRLVLVLAWIHAEAFICVSVPTCTCTGLNSQTLFPLPPPPISHYAQMSSKTQGMDELHGAFPGLAPNYPHPNVIAFCTCMYTVHSSSC